MAIDINVIINQAYRYFFPPRGLHRLPRTISAQYARGEITKTQAIIMMAGLARDPQEAQQVYDKLYAKHGLEVWDYVQFEVRRARAGTFGERFMKLCRRMMGEHEYQNLRYRANEPIVHVRHRLPDGD